MHLKTVATALALIGAGFPALAQDTTTDSETLNQLFACRELTDDAARLACQDTHLTALAQATETGRVVIVERQALREVERESFGFNLPSVGRLGGILRRPAQQDVVEAQTEVLEDGSTATYSDTGSLDRLTGVPVSNVSMRGGKLRVTLANGQVWDQTDSTRLPRITSRAIREGLTAEIETGVLGAHFMTLSNNERRRFRAERVQ